MRSAAGRITAICCFTWKRACSGKCGWKNDSARRRLHCRRATVLAFASCADDAAAQCRRARRPAVDRASRKARSAQPRQPKRQDLPPFIPPLTDEDRKAHFRTSRDTPSTTRPINYFVLFDQLEWQAGDAAERHQRRQPWMDRRDRDRLWFRAEGESEAAASEEAQAHVLYGRQVSRWWDVVAGIRQDFRPGPAQTWAAFGVQGLAPYWFEIEATAYIGASGRTHARFEVEYELLLTNRLIVQPLFEAEIFGKSDPERGIGRGPEHDRCWDCVCATSSNGKSRRTSASRGQENGERPPTSRRPRATDRRRASRDRTAALVLEFREGRMIVLWPRPLAEAPVVIAAQLTLGHQRLTSRSSAAVGKSRRS